MTPPDRPRLVDTHAHLQDPHFDGDRAAVLARAQSAGLCALICVGWDLESSRLAVQLAGEYDSVFAAVGVHPNHAGQAREADWDELCELARSPKVVGIGETGLDNYREFTPPEVQERWFGRHLALAAELGLPVVVHCRQADQRVSEILADWASVSQQGQKRGVMHCFSAGRDTLEACLSLGFQISIAGPVTFKNAEPLREIARAVPADRLLIETDCPYLTPHPRRGQRNEPAFIEYTARALATLCGESYSELAEKTTETATQLFGLNNSREHGATPGNKGRRGSMIEGPATR